MRAIREMVNTALGTPSQEIEAICTGALRLSIASEQFLDLSYMRRSVLLNTNCGVLKHVGDEAFSGWVGGVLQRLLLPGQAQ